MTEKHLRKCLIFFAFWKMKIKTTLSSHFMPFRLAKIKNNFYSLCWRVCGVRGTVWLFLRTLEINVPQGPAIPLLGTYPKDAQLYFKAFVQLCL